uniref:Uncharacterized protein n=1 Tax=Timspurckia oligopyrenoides TaxID=708627 RepID=A0A7S0ZGE9_9RHOD|mmetsp:Transcript_4158/g.7302  ORF Transcript_4158/g.7302 Transcript_4158/m.7302 type:complete len:317 (+) Transcript_4158:23-973(+)
MCGRFALQLSREDVEQVAQTSNWENGVDGVEYAPNSNIKPTNSVPVLYADGNADELVKRKLRMMRWGLIPSWTKQNEGPLLFNARVETVESKASFRAAWKSRHFGVVFADAFYEWKSLTTNPQGKKQKIPYRISSVKTLRMAAIFDIWHPPGQSPVFSFTILTENASSEMQWLHDRMPVLLDAEQSEKWLNGSAIGVQPREPSTVSLVFEKMRPDLSAIDSAGDSKTGVQQSLMSAFLKQSKVESKHSVPSKRPMSTPESELAKGNPKQTSDSPKDGIKMEQKASPKKEVQESSAPSNLKSGKKKQKTLLAYSQTK